MLYLHRYIWIIGISMLTSQLYAFSHPGITSAEENNQQTQKLLQKEKELSNEMQSHIDTFKRVQEQGVQPQPQNIEGQTKKEQLSYIAKQIVARAQQLIKIEEKLKNTKHRTKEQTQQRMKELRNTRDTYRQYIIEQPELQPSEINM